MVRTSIERIADPFHVERGTMISVFYLYLAAAINCIHCLIFFKKNCPTRYNYFIYNTLYIYYQNSALLRYV